VIALLLALVALFGAHPVPTHCAEDDPCWNCHTMGNHRCGPGAG
jgi:hypothetical protein